MQMLSFYHRNDVSANIKNARYSTYIGFAILLVVLLVSPVIICLVRNATNTIQVLMVMIMILKNKLLMCTRDTIISFRFTLAIYPKKPKS